MITTYYYEYRYYVGYRNINMALSHFFHVSPMFQLFSFRYLLYSIVGSFGKEGTEEVIEVLAFKFTV